LLRAEQVGPPLLCQQPPKALVASDVHIEALTCVQQLENRDGVEVLCNRTPAITVNVQHVGRLSCAETKLCICPVNWLSKEDMNAVLRVGEIDLSLTPDILSGCGCLEGSNFCWEHAGY
jgi:hypothetical protein